jgi:hypothetical protein
LRIAASHERLASLAEGLKVTRDADDVSDNHVLPAYGARRMLTTVGYGEEPLGRHPHEDAIGTARRHVREAEHRIARQERLVAKLSSDDRHAALAAEAREILATLEHSLSLAKQHLAIELKK